MRCTFPQKRAWDQIASVASAIIAIFAIGYTLGRFVSASLYHHGTPMEIAADTQIEIPVIELNGIYDGELTGSITGEMRMFLRGEIILPDGSGAFRVPAPDFFVNYIQVRVPEGMNFVASRRGKKYYPVSSAAGSRLVPEQRVYFPDIASAEQAGYVQ